MDKATFIGLFLGVFSILLGQNLEGGHLGSILKPTAALIVIGGTIGATLLGFPMRDFIKALKMSSRALKEPKEDTQKIFDQIVEFANIARRDGLITLEKKADQVENPLLSKGLRYMIDGLDPPIVRSMLEDEYGMQEEEAQLSAKVFEAAGGYAPTIGILGAVLGLIHTMENLNDPSKLGEGIAVAFVATIYGVGAANLLFLPIANKLKLRIQEEGKIGEMIVQGILGLQEGLHPRVIESKLKPYLGEPEEKKG